MNAWTDEQMDGWMGEWMHERNYDRTKEGMDEWKEWMNGRMAE